MTTSTTIESSQLPAVVRSYLAAHAGRDADTAARAFAPSAVVTDEGRTYRGTDEVLEFLRSAGGQFTYTTELVSAERVDDTHWVAANRLEGDFPGGVAELRYRFTVVDGLVTELVIAP
jgi:ketosteroid isomerase-like protein